MVEFSITDESVNGQGITYIKNSLAELTERTETEVRVTEKGGRTGLVFRLHDCYSEVIRGEIADRASEVIAVGYKSVFFKSAVKISGLKAEEREILYSAMISADLKEDKKTAFAEFSRMDRFSIDGVFNFRLKNLRKKWKEIGEYMPSVFFGEQLKDFMGFLLENRKKRAYIDGVRVYDNYFRRLMRCSLTGFDGLKVVRELIMSGCGEAEIRGDIPAEDEGYLKEFYGDKIYFSPNPV